VRPWIYGGDQPWAPQDDAERLDGYPSAKNIRSKKLAQQEIRHRFFALMDFHTPTRSAGPK
jgi:hypothetical protein